MNEKICVLKSAVEDIMSKKQLSWQQVGLITQIPGITIAMAMDGKTDLPEKVWESILCKLQEDFIFVEPRRASLTLVADANGEIRLPSVWQKKMRVSAGNRVIQMDNFDTHVEMRDTLSYRFDKERKRVSDDMLARGYELL